MWDLLPEEDKLAIVVDTHNLPSINSSLHLKHASVSSLEVEKIARDWIFDLHALRWKLLDTKHDVHPTQSLLP